MTTSKAVLLDIDGVLVTSWAPIDGAAEAVARIREAGCAVAFLTNTTSRPRSAVAAQLRAAGIRAEVDEVHTAATAAASHIRRRRPDARCLLLNSGSVGADLAGVRLVEAGADVVLTGGAGPEIGYEVLNHAFRELIGGASLLVMNPSCYWATAEGLQLDMGSFVVGLERAAGVKGTLVGKPATAFFTAALEQVGAKPSEAVMVGDDVESDVLGAQALGIDGILVRTGKFTTAALEAASGEPNHVLSSVAALPSLLGLPG
jgi:HAD superfamily hydrolase (TIGR01458 family)